MRAWGTSWRARWSPPAVCRTATPRTLPVTLPSPISTTGRTALSTPTPTPPWWAITTCGRTPTPPSTSMRRASTWATGTTRRRTTWAFCKTTTTGRMASYTPSGTGSPTPPFPSGFSPSPRAAGRLQSRCGSPTRDAGIRERTWCSSTAPRPTPSLTGTTTLKSPPPCSSSLKRPDPSLPGSTRTWRLPSPGRRWPPTAPPAETATAPPGATFWRRGTIFSPCAATPTPCWTSGPPMLRPPSGTTTTIPVRRRSAPSPLWIRTAACSATRPGAARPIRRPSTGFACSAPIWPTRRSAASPSSPARTGRGPSPPPPPTRTGTPRTQWCSGLRRTTPPNTTTPQTAAWATIRAVWSTGRKRPSPGRRTAWCWPICGARATTIPCGTCCSTSSPSPTPRSCAAVFLRTPTTPGP